MTAYLKEFKDKSENCSVEDVTEMLRDSRPFVKVAESRFAININKVILGRFLALEVLKLSDKDGRVLQGAGVLTGTEVSRFLRWAMGWPQEVPPEENDDDLEIAFPEDPPKMRFPSSTAIHEAGHGLLFDAVGLDVIRISIETLVSSDYNLDEHVLLRGIAPDPLGIAGGLAGVAANIYLEGRSPTSLADEASRSVDKYLRAKCKEASKSRSFETNWAMMQRSLHGWIRDWVRANEAAILRLAHALDAAKCLEGVALSKALNESWGDARPDASQLEREIATGLKFS